MNIKAIKDERIDHDLTQQEVAEKLGISRQYYSRYEAGEVEIPVRHLITLAQLYNCSIDYLVGISAKSANASENMQLYDLKFANEIKKIYKKYYGSKQQ